MHADAMNHHPDPLTLAAATWLACGVVLFGLTPLPWHDAAFGWSLAFWTLAAPVLVLGARSILARRHAPAERVPRRAHRTPARPHPTAIRRRAGSPLRRGRGPARAAAKSKSA